MPNDILRTQMSYYDEFLYETRLCAYKPIGAGSFFCYSILSQLFLSILKTFAIPFQSTLSLTLLTFLVFRKKKEKKPCAYQEKKKAKKQSWKCKNEREQMEVTAADVPGTKACQRIRTTHDREKMRKDAKLEASVGSFLRICGSPLVIELHVWPFLILHFQVLRNTSIKGFVRPSTRLSVRLSVYPSLRPSVCLSVLKPFHFRWFRGVSKHRVVSNGSLPPFSSPSSVIDSIASKRERALPRSRSTTL